ncbi:MAG: dihydrofolate reductase [Myxococcales bacterium]|nr:dihydrofolate reductase [Myxococcales bacterium]
MKGIIYAVSPQGIIGVGGKIPWRYLGDWRRFKRITMGSTLVMGRTTFESIGKPLPGRRNLVVTSREIELPGIECVRSVDEALARAGDADVWFIGGARIYSEAMKHADVIDVTYVPDYVDGWDIVRAPAIDEGLFEPGPLLPHEEEPALRRRVYTRRRALGA